MSVPHGILYLNQQESSVVAGLLSLPLDLKVVQGGQVNLRVAGELESVQLGANIEVPPQGSHVFPPPVCLLNKESIFCHL